MALGLLPRTQDFNISQVPCSDPSTFSRRPEADLERAGSLE